MTPDDLDRQLRDAFGDQRAAARAARSAHHVQGRRRGGLAALRGGNGASFGARWRSRASPACLSRMLGGGSNVLVADRRRPWPCHPAPRRHGRPPSIQAACEPMRRSRSTGSCAGRSIAASPASRPGPGRRAPSAAPFMAMRTSRDATSAIWSTRVTLIGSVRGAGGRADARDGVRVRLQPAASHGRGRARPRIFTPVEVSRPRCVPSARESLAFRKRTQPLESASAGCIFQNPDPSRDRVPDGIPPSAGALVDRAGLKGSREGHAPRVDDPCQFHRERGRRDRR